MTINKTKDDTESGATARDLQVLPVDGSELTYEVRGEGPPVLLIHGIAGRIEVWSDIQEALARTHRVIAYDLRGHGRSPNPTPDVRVHAKDAAALIEHAAGEPAIVAGWSSGANVTLQLVDDQPELAEAVVLVESGFHMTRHPVSTIEVPGACHLIPIQQPEAVVPPSAPPSPREEASQRLMMPRLVTLGSPPEPSTPGRSSRYQATMRGIPLSRGLTRPTTTGTIARSRTLVYRLLPERPFNLTLSATT